VKILGADAVRSGLDRVSRHSNVSFGALKETPLGLVEDDFRICL
jgi:hypothetical protein